MITSPTPRSRPTEPESSPALPNPPRSSHFSPTNQIRPAHVPPCPSPPPPSLLLPLPSLAPYRSSPPASPRFPYPYPLPSRFSFPSPSPFPSLSPPAPPSPSPSPPLPPCSPPLAPSPPPRPPPIPERTPHPSRSERETAGSMGAAERAARAPSRTLHPPPRTSYPLSAPTVSMTPHNPLRRRVTVRKRPKRFEIALNCAKSPGKEGREKERGGGGRRSRLDMFWSDLVCG